MKHANAPFNIELSKNSSIISLSIHLKYVDFVYTVFLRNTNKAFKMSESWRVSFHLWLFRLCVHCTVHWKRLSHSVSVSTYQYINSLCTALMQNSFTALEIARTQCDTSRSLAATERSELAPNVVNRRVCTPDQIHSSTEKNKTDNKSKYVMTCRDV